MPVPYAAIAAAAAPSIAGAFGKKKKTKQQPLVPPQVLHAMDRLNDFSRTGTFGDFTAGAEVPLEYGDFNASDIEQQGLSSLQQLLGSGVPDQFRVGDEALTGLINQRPEDINAQFDPFRAQVQRQIRDSNDALKRSAGFAGNLYSTDTVRRLGDIEARGNETLTAELARLTNDAMNRRTNTILSAAPLLYGSGESQEGIRSNRIGSAFQYGGLTRQLNDQARKSRDAEILRRRQELQLPIQASQTVAGFSPPYGVPEIETSPFDDILGLVGQIGGNYLGNELSMRQYARHFPQAR